jgi:hypothetical protein
MVVWVVHLKEMNDTPMVYSNDNFSKTQFSSHRDLMLYASHRCLHDCVKSLNSYEAQIRTQTPDTTRTLTHRRR